MPDARCTRGLVCKLVRKNAHEHTGSAEALRHSLRNGFTAYIELSPATNSSCHRHRRIGGLVEPGRANKNLRRLDTSNGCQNHRTQPPHAKGLDGPGTHPPKFWRRRDQRRSSARGLIAHEPLTEPPCDCLARPTLPRPPHPMPNVRDDHDTPLLGAGMGRAGSADLPDGTSGIFSSTGLDRANHVEVAVENRLCAHVLEATFSRQDSL